MRRVYQRYVETGGYVRRHGGGRHRVTSQQDDRFLFMTSLRNRHLNAVQLGQQLQRARNVSVSRWTVRRRLAAGGLTAHRPATGPKLTPAHRQARLRFAQEHLNWTFDRDVFYSRTSAGSVYMATMDVDGCIEGLAKGLHSAA